MCAQGHTADEAPRTTAFVDLDERASKEVAALLRRLNLEPTRRKLPGRPIWRVSVEYEPVPLSPTPPYTAQNLPRTRGPKRDPIRAVIEEIPPGGRGPDLELPRSEYDRIQGLVSRWRNRPGGKPVYVRLLRTLDDGRVVAGFFHVLDG